MKSKIQEFRLHKCLSVSKNIFFIAIAMMFSYTTSFAQTKTPKAIETAFKLKFPKATKVKWDKESATEYEANFVINGVKHSANYSNDGTWLETESTTTFDKLPVKVQNAFTASHKKEKVKAIAVIENSTGKILYEIEVTKGLKAIEYFYNADGTISK